MRFSQAQGASSNSASMRSNEETNRIFEEDNNRMLSELENKVTQLKNVGAEIALCALCCRTRKQYSK
jgi:hypothetical protein